MYDGEFVGPLTKEQEKLPENSHRLSNYERRIYEHYQGSSCSKKKGKHEEKIKKFSRNHGKDYISKEEKRRVKKRHTKKKGKTTRK